MITFLLTMGGLVAYLAIGATAARIARPGILAKATYRKGDGYMTSGYYGHWAHREADGIERGLVIFATWVMLLGWPVYSWVYAVNASVHKAADRVDPTVHAEQAERIRELERELLGEEADR